MTEALWQFAQQASRLAEDQIVSGVVRHPVTRNWQTWFSLYGNDITCIFASQRYDLAHSVRQMFVAKLRAGDLSEPDCAREFMRGIQALEGSELIDPLPSRSLRQLGHYLRHHLTQD